MHRTRPLAQRPRLTGASKVPRRVHRFRGAEAVLHAWDEEVAVKWIDLYPSRFERFEHGSVKVGGTSRRDQSVARAMVGEEFTASGGEGPEVEVVGVAVAGVCTVGKFDDGVVEIIEVPIGARSRKYCGYS